MRTRRTRTSVNRSMSFAEPPSRRERLSRLPAFAQYEERNSEADAYPGYGTGYSDAFDSPGASGFPGASAQGPPWDAPARPGAPVPRTRVTDSFEAVPGRRSVLADEVRSRGLLAGAVSGVLAAALALGIANLAAAFVRPQASPIIAVGGAFIDRTPPWLKNFAVQYFGQNDKNMLLLGMYTTIALLAMGIGMIAWRHVSVGVVALALFGAFGAFVAYTRPESQTTDVIPSIAGGVAGIAAIALLVLAGHSQSRFRTDRGDW